MNQNHQCIDPLFFVFPSNFLVVDCLDLLTLLSKSKGEIKELLRSDVR
jgi:hypothetical protein